MDPPLLPHQLFRQLARNAWLHNLAGLEAAAAGASSNAASNALYSAEGGGLGSEDFDFGGVAGDIFAGASTEADAGLEDEDMQAAGFTV